MVTVTDPVGLSFEMMALPAPVRLLSVSQQQVLPPGVLYVPGAMSIPTA